MDHKKDITGIILAGGKSSRMKTDKGFIVLGEKLFIEHIIDALAPLVKNIIIVSSNSNYDEFGLKRVKDIIKDQGPLGGLVTGLHHSKTDYNLVLSCDIPLITSEVLQLLISESNNDSDVIQFESTGKTMPLIAMYHKRCLDSCNALLLRGEKRLRVAVSRLNTKTLILDSKLDPYVKNINTVDELISLKNAVKH